MHKLFAREYLAIYGAMLLAIIVLFPPDELLWKAVGAISGLGLIIYGAGLVK